MAILTVFHPGKGFPAYSVTGTGCQLGCDHCRGRHLIGMRPIGPPERSAAELVALAGQVEGVLLSGGCDRDGRVPLLPYLGAVAAARDVGLSVNLHPGLVDGDAAALVASGADRISVDLVQDPQVIDGVFHLRRSPEDYEHTLRELVDAGAAVVPHICVGLGSQAAEDRALELAASCDIRALVVLAFLPTWGTPMFTKRSPDDARVTGLVRRAVEMLDCPVALGCMRPRGRPSLEIGCIEAGATGIVNPSREALRWVSENGHRVRESRLCCAYL